MTVSTQFRREHFVHALEDAGLSGDAISETYSGRGMYGEKCPSITVDSMREAMMFAGALGHCDEDDEWSGLLRSATFDQMGLGMVVYFPGWELTEDR